MVTRKITYRVLVIVLLLLSKVQAYAQCSMCRASMENSISRDSEQFSAGLNTGILYLFVVPYILFALIAYFWYRSSKKNEGKIKIKIRSSR